MLGNMVVPATSQMIYSQVTMLYKVTVTGTHLLTVLLVRQMFLLF